MGRIGRRSQVDHPGAQVARYRHEHGVEVVPGSRAAVVAATTSSPVALDLHQTKQRWHTIVMQIVTQPITLDTFNLASNERRLCVEALAAAGNLVGAAKLLGITRHSMKRRIVKLGLDWARRPGQLAAAGPVATAPVAAHAA